MTMNNVTFHILETSEIQQALAKGGLPVLASTGLRMTICYTPVWLARCLAKRYRAPFAIAGDVLYTPTPAAFIGRDGVCVKWSASKGGWSRVVSIEPFRVTDGGPYNLRLQDPRQGPDQYYLFPENHPAYVAEWER